MPHRDLGDTFVPAVDAAVPTGHDTLQDRQDSTCVQSVEHPVWYGADFDTCSMTTTTAPCSVVFPSTSCHTVGPGRFLMADGMLESIKLWTVIGMTVFLTMLIPVSILWMRWKLSSPRRGGKRSISIQLEKNEDKGSSKQQATSESSSTPETASGNRRDLLGPNSRLDALNRLLGRDRGTRAGESGMRSYTIVIENFQLIAVQGTLKLSTMSTRMGRKQAITRTDASPLLCRLPGRRG